MADPTLRRWREMMEKGGAEAQKATVELVTAQANKKLPAPITDPKFARSVWERSTAIMEKYNEPGRFTALIGYEWTSNAGGGDNLHRNVIYRDGKDKADQVVPMTTFDTQNPEDLWTWMASYEQKTGGRLLAIPHNGNLSNGRMFQLRHFRGQADDARVCRGAQPLGAAVRGDPDQGPERGASARFARRRVPRQLRAVGQGQPHRGAEEARHDATPSTCARRSRTASPSSRSSAPIPFKYGMAAGSDTHNGLTAMEEDNFYGKMPGSEARPDRWKKSS